MDIYCYRCGQRNAASNSLCEACNIELRKPSPSLEDSRIAALKAELQAAKESVARLKRYVPKVVAEQVLQEPERLQGERREVAVLFADAVNFTRLSASLDAETVFELINDLLSRLVACVHRYGGMVDKFTGDGLMAVFGAPIAQENDVELAVRAALDMQKAASEFAPVAQAQLGTPLRIRVGVHSGLAIGGILGSEEQAAYTVIGETVNLAARIQEKARPGHVLVSPRVYRQTQGLFNFRARNPQRVKGLKHPLKIYEVVRERATPMPTRGVSGITPIFLGRERELEELHAYLNAFLSDRHRRVVVVEGEAGVGKSRLVSEWLASIEPDEVTIWQGVGLPYAQGLGYGIFRSMLQDALSQTKGSREEIWEQHISPTMRPFLKQILGEQISQEAAYAHRALAPERIKRLTMLALRDWIANEAQRRPLIVVLDDYHWADDLSRDALDSIVSLLGESPVLFCLVTRPQTEALRVAESTNASHYLAVQLAPLASEESRTLLSYFIDTESFPEENIEKILTLSQGNPFYIEEYVRTLVEKEVIYLEDGQWHRNSENSLGELKIPTSLRGLMMARVDRLPETLRNLLRVAAVVGSQFETPLLESVMQQLYRQSDVSPILQRLVRLGFIVPRPEIGKEIYTFRHTITQEVVYRSILRSERPELHRLVAESIEFINQDNLYAQAEVLALHYQKAHVREKELQYALLAGERARQRFANEEAIDYYSRALQLAQHYSNRQEEQWQAAVGLGDVQQHIGEYEEALISYQNALEEWPYAPSEVTAQVMLKISLVWDKRGEFSKVGFWLQESLKQLKDKEVGEGAIDLKAQIYSGLGWLDLRRGNVQEGQKWLEKALALVKDTTYYQTLASVLNRLGAVYYNRSKWQQATEYVEQALEYRKLLGDIVGYARSLNNLGVLQQASGNWNEALQSYKQAAELHRRIHEVNGLGVAQTNLGVLYTERGEYEKAQAHLREGLAITQSTGNIQGLAHIHLNLARIHVLEERWSAAAEHLQKTLSLYQETENLTHYNLKTAYELYSKWHLAQGQVKEAKHWAERSYQLLEEATEDSTNSIEWSKYHQLQGRIAYTEGKLQEALTLLEKSKNTFLEQQAPIEAARTAYWKAQLLYDLNRLDEAYDELSMAQKVFKRLDCFVDLKKIRSLMELVTEERKILKQQKN